MEDYFVSRQGGVAGARQRIKGKYADWVSSGWAAIGSGGSYALAAARALVDIEGMDAQQIGDGSSPGFLNLLFARRLWSRCPPMSSLPNNLIFSDVFSF
jgi:hypothetical protein